MEITLVAPYQISFDHNVSYRLLCSIENCCKSEPLIFDQFVLKSNPLINVQSELHLFIQGGCL